MLPRRFSSVSSIAINSRTRTGRRLVKQVLVAAILSASQAIAVIAPLDANEEASHQSTTVRLACARIFRKTDKEHIRDPVVASGHNASKRIEAEKDHASIFSIETRLMKEPRGDKCEGHTRRAFSRSS